MLSVASQRRLKILFRVLFGLRLSVVMTQLEYPAKTTSNPAISHILQPRVNVNDGCCLKMVKSSGEVQFLQMVIAARSTQQE